MRQQSEMVITYEASNKYGPSRSWHTTWTNDTLPPGWRVPCVGELVINGEWYVVTKVRWMESNHHTPTIVYVKLEVYTG